MYITFCYPVKACHLKFKLHKGPKIYYELKIYCYLSTIVSEILKRIHLKTLSSLITSSTCSDTVVCLPDKFISELSCGTNFNKYLKLALILVYAIKFGFLIKVCGCLTFKLLFFIILFRFINLCLLYLLLTIIYFSMFSVIVTLVFI